MLTEKQRNDNNMAVGQTSLKNKTILTETAGLLGLLCCFRKVADCSGRLGVALQKN
jgi:hypothetical protein